MVEILIALVLGFCAGILGALVTHEMLIQKFEEEHLLEKQKNEELQNHIKYVITQYQAVTVALQELTYKFVRERGALWQSLNDLWIDYDRRNKQEDPEPEPEPEKEEETDEEH